MKNITLVGCLTLFTSCMSSKKEKSEIPSFNLLMLDSATQFNTSQIPNGKPIVLLFFSPDCEHCQAEATYLLRKMDSLKEVDFYFVSIDPLDRLRIFNACYNLYHYSNITLGKDYTYSFPRYFKGASPPYLILYDKKKKTRAVFSGDTYIDHLVPFVRKISVD